MRDKRIVLIAVYGLLLITVGCPVNPPAPSPAPPPVRSVAVDPALGAYYYANIGDKLEFRALNPNSADFYVIFDDPSPCKQTVLLVTKDKPATCTVLSQLKPYHYSLSPTPPTLTKPPKPFRDPRNCPQCTVILLPPPGGPTPPPPNNPTPVVPSGGTALSPRARTGRPAAVSNVEPVDVTCNPPTTGTATAEPKEQFQYDRIFWYDDTYPNLTITLPANVCNDINNNPQTVFKEYEPCKLIGKPQKTPYTYTVQAKGCPKTGTGSLTIDAPETNGPQ